MKSYGMICCLFLLNLVSLSLLQAGEVGDGARVNLPLSQYEALRGEATTTRLPTVSRVDVRIRDDGDSTSPIVLEAVYDVQCTSAGPVELKLLTVPPSLARVEQAEDQHGPVPFNMKEGIVTGIFVGAGRRRFRLVLGFQRVARYKGLLQEVEFSVPEGIGASSLTLDVRPLDCRLLEGNELFSAGPTGWRGYRRHSGTVAAGTSVRLLWARPSFAPVAAAAAVIVLDPYGSRADFLFEVPGAGARTVLLRFPEHVELRPAAGMHAAAPATELNVAVKDSPCGFAAGYLVAPLRHEQRYVRVPVSLARNCWLQMEANHLVQVPLVTALDATLAIAVRCQRDFMLFDAFVASAGGKLAVFEEQSTSGRLLARLEEQLGERAQYVRRSAQLGVTGLQVPLRSRVRPRLQPAAVSIVDIAVECFVPTNGTAPLIHYRYVIENTTKPEFELDGLSATATIVAAFSNGMRVSPLRKGPANGHCAIPLTFFSPCGGARRGIVDLYLQEDEIQPNHCRLYGAWRLPLKDPDLGAATSVGSLIGPALGLSERGQDIDGDGPLPSHPHSPTVAAATAAGPQWHRPITVDVYAMAGAVAAITPSVRASCEQVFEVSASKRIEGPLPVPARGAPARWKVELLHSQGPQPLAELSLSVSSPFYQRLRELFLFLGVCALLGGWFCPVHQVRLAVLGGGTLLTLLGLLVAPPLDGNAVSSIGAGLVVALVSYGSYLAMWPDADDDDYIP